MNDQELLELAAKAAGFDSVIEMYGLNEIGEPLLDANDPPTVWNPLTDDGDALRLAVKLELMVDCGSSMATLGDLDYWIDGGRDEPYAATRRAIVRAAADIGKGME